MIRFNEDWSRYPEAIADTSTTNETFLNLAKIYKTMGVRNYAFPLALHDAKLQGIDPHRKDLTREEQVRITKECKINPWYVLREVIRIPAHGSPEPVPYIANRANIAVVWLYLSHVDVINVQPRQTGKSTSVDALWVTVLFLMSYGTKVQLFTENNKLRKENVLRLKSIRDSLPSYLNPTGITDADNTELVTVNARSNRYLTAVGRPSAEGANSIGRGLSSQNFHGDEIAYTPNVHISMPVALASGTNARLSASKAGSLYGNIFTTTSGKLDTPTGAYAYSMVEDSAYWTEVFLDSKDVGDLHTVVLKNSTHRLPSVNATFSHRQLGLSDEWCMNAIANARGTRESAERDFLNKWSNGSISSPLSTGLNTAVFESEVEPSYTEVTKDMYVVNWYIPQSDIHSHMANTHHLITLDTAQAVGKDSNSLTIQDVRNMAVVATSDVNEANLLKYAIWIAKLLMKYTRTTLVIENAASGQAIIDIIMVHLYTAGIDPFKRIFNRVVDESLQNPDDFIALQGGLSRRTEHLYMKYKGKFGFKTTGASRFQLYDSVLQRAASTTAHRVHDKKLSSQLRSLVVKNGRVDHPPGGHDDLVISWLMGHWFINNAINHAWYGIPADQCLSHVTSDGALLSDAELDKRSKQAEVRIQLEDLKSEYAACKVPQVKMNLERVIRRLTKITDNDGGVVVSFDSLMMDARERKAKGRSMAHNLRRHF